MDAWIVGLILMVGLVFLVSGYYAFRRMRAEDELRLSGRKRPEVSSFARDKDRAEVAEAERQLRGGR